MNAKLAELEERRAALVARAALQREQLAQYSRQASRPLFAAEHGWALAKSLRSSPIAIAGLTAVLLKTPWRKVAKVPRLLWIGWALVRAARNLGTRRRVIL